VPLEQVGYFHDWLELAPAHPAEPILEVSCLS
jgi:hypothetical protein